MASLIVHHLEHSRSQRILWLLEEIAAPYEIKRYARNPVTNLAPPELKAVHPLGKSPLLEHNGRVIQESGAIVEYICDRFPKANSLVPTRGTDDHVRHLEMMHFAEGSAMIPILLQLYTSKLGAAAAPLMPRITEQLGSYFGFLETELRPSGFFVGDKLTASDIMLSFPAEIAILQGGGAIYPKLDAFVKSIQARPAYVRALQKGGPYRFAPNAPSSL